MKVPFESSAHWDSMDSQRSTSGGSSGEASCSSGSASRHYVDPWDLENYAYLRRHSVAGLTQQASGQHRRSTQRFPEEARAHPEYRCSSSLREPGYDAPGFVEELYYGPNRAPNNACCYHQAIYEDDVPDYVARFPVYAPVSEFRRSEIMEDHRGHTIRHRCKSMSTRELHRAEYVDRRMLDMNFRELDIPVHQETEYQAMSLNPTQERYAMEILPPPFVDLNTYGHLKIDYTNSWNSLNRKIRN